MKQFQQPGPGDYLKSIVYLLIYLGLLVGGAVLLLPTYWYLWGLIVAVGMIALVNWHQQQTVYQCPNCGHIYTINFFKDLTAPHGIGRQGAWLLLRCPNCQQRKKTRVLKRTRK